MKKKNGSMISDSWITASSEYSDTVHQEHGAPHNARLDHQAGDVNIGAWAASQSDTAPWIQIRFSFLMSVAGIVLQGRQDLDQWVTKYEVQYSSNDGVTWEHVKDDNRTTGRVSPEEEYQGRGTYDAITGPF